MNRDEEVKQRVEWYEFLGWLNGWLKEQAQIKRGFCIGKKHAGSDIQHDPRGSENTVICDICKIYWKYDCSD